MDLGGRGKPWGTPRNPFPRLALSAGKGAERHFPLILSVWEASRGTHPAPAPEARKRESWQRERTTCRAMA